MAKVSSAATRRVTGIKATSLAMFEGVFAAIIGITVGILYSLETTVEMAKATQSLLAGMAFGLTSGVVSIILLPFVYFGIGWVVGLLHGWIFNAVVSASGGLVFNSED